MGTINWLDSSPPPDWEGKPVIYIADDVVGYYALLPDGWSDEDAVNAFCSTYDYREPGTLSDDDPGGSDEGLREILTVEVYDRWPGAAP